MRSVAPSLSGRDVLCWAWGLTEGRVEPLGGKLRQV